MIFEMSKKKGYINGPPGERIFAAAFRGPRAPKENLSDLRSAFMPH